MIETLVGFVAMFALMTLRVPIAFSMAVVGFAGLWLMRSWPAAVASTTTVRSISAVADARSASPRSSDAVRLRRDCGES